MALGLLVLLPGVLGTRSLLATDSSWVAFQAKADRTTGADAAGLLAIAASRGGGRVYAGKLNDWGKSFQIGGASAPIWLANYPVDSLGYNLRVSSLAADLETYLDDSTSADLDGFGVRYVLVPQGHTPPRGAWFLASRGSIQLWEVPGEGMVSAVDLAGPSLPVGNDELAAELLPLLRSQGGSPTAVRLLDLEGRSPQVPVATTGLDVRPGTVSHTDLDLDAGHAATTARFTKPGAVLVKADWNPRWHATVDGKAVPVVMVAPTWLAIPVGPGTHRVSLSYHSWPWTPELLLVAALAVAAAWWWGRRWPGPLARPTDPDGSDRRERSDRSDLPPGAVSTPVAGPSTRSVGSVEPIDGTAGQARMVARRVGPGARGRSHRTRAGAGLGDTFARSSSRRVAVRRVGAGLVGAVALVALVGCGPVHRLPSAPSRPPSASSPAARLSLIRSDSLGPLDRMLAPDRRTVVLLAGPGCTRCTAALAALQRVAVGPHPFSLLLVGLPAVPGPLGTRATQLGISQWSLAAPGAARALGDLHVRGRSGLVVFDPDGRLVRSVDGVPASTASVARTAAGRA